MRLTAYLLLAATVAAPLFLQGQAPLRAKPSNDGLHTSTGAARNQEFLRRIHYPLGQPEAVHYEAWQEARQGLRPKAGTALARTRSTNAWIPDGPNGVKLPGQETFFSGRIRDIGITASGQVRIGAASGGLWERQSDNRWVPLSDSITSQAIGTFHTSPLDDDVILVGTGEASQRNGTGVWRTEDRGVSWSQIPLSPSVSTCRTLRFDPQDSARVHLAAAQGYYRSLDGGRSFQHVWDGEFDDVQINPANPQRVYVSRRFDGLYRSDAGGDSASFIKLAGPWDTVVYGRGVLAICTMDPDVIYFNLIRPDNWRTEGVYRSDDGGDNWVRCRVEEPDGTLVEDFHWGQGWYNTLVAVKPDDCNMAHVGGGSFWRTIDSVTFKEIDPVHVDLHRMIWAPDGSEAWLANDGGLFRSDEGWTFEGSSAINGLPIRQYSSFSVGVTNPRVQAGGSQDNGIAVRSSLFGDWRFTIGGDGGAVAISRYDHTLIFATNGVYGGDLSFRNQISFSEGSFWNDRNNGMLPCGQWWRNMRDNERGDVYTHCGGDVYFSSDLGDSWDLINDGASWFTADLWNLTVSQGEPENVYACLANGALRRLQVLDRATGNWIDRSSGLPSDTYVRTVVPDPVYPDRAWAIMGGVPASGDLGRKVFRTDDAGSNWINATGNLPNIPLTDALVHPADSATLVVCGDIGCFMTEDEGATWTDWSEGLPTQLLFTELGSIDSTTINGRWWIYGATYGRSVWKRMVQGEVIVPPSGLASPEPLTLSLAPNPAHEFVTLRFARSAPASYRIMASDGRSVGEGLIPFGQDAVSINVAALAAGIYTVLVSDDQGRRGSARLSVQ